MDLSGAGEQRLTCPSTIYWPIGTIFLTLSHQHTRLGADLEYRIRVFNIISITRYGKAGRSIHYAPFAHKALILCEDAHCIRDGRNTPDCLESC